MKRTILVLLLFAFCFSFAQTKKVLIYHETNGFRHGSISNGITMITNQGNSNGLWTVDDSQSSDVFTTSNLAQYDAVIWLNTSGNNLLSATEQTAFENFIINGGGFVGVHAATDTYRDGSWPFYNELVGGIVQTSPNHTSNNFNADMTVENTHPSVNFLGSVGSVWNKDEEYYYWEQNGGQLSTDNTTVLEVESTGGNSYDVARPIAWYKQSITVGGTTYNNLKSFYTALGHNGSDYNSNSNFQSHIEEAIKWVIGEATLNTDDTAIKDFKAFPNPLKGKLTLQFEVLTEDAVVTVYNVLGKQVYNGVISASDMRSGNHEMDLTYLGSGVYILSFKTFDASKTIKLVKQ